MRKSALILTLVGLAGCSTPESKWNRPGATERQRATDYAYCQNQGQRTWMGIGPVGVAIAIATADRRTEDNYRACMRARGWTTEQPSEEESAQNESQQEQAKITLAEMRKQIPTRPTCALGTQLLPGSSAAVVIAVGPSAVASGIQVGDRIVRVNDDPVRGVSGVTEALQRYSPGDDIRLTVQRARDSVMLTATCADRRVQMQPAVAVFEAMAAGQWSSCFDRVVDGMA
jgi:S1-C subfamily serine protease